MHFQIYASTMLEMFRNILQLHTRTVFYIAWFVVAVPKYVSPLQNFDVSLKKCEKSGFLGIYLVIS